MKRRLSRHRAGLAALLCVAGAIVLALLASDLHTWQTTVTRDDLRFRALPAHKGLWRPQTLLPGDPAGALAGTGGTVSWRRALQDFWYSRVGTDADVRDGMPTMRATAQEKLQALIRSAPTAAQRSTAANLLGVLVVTAPVPGTATDALEQLLREAASDFQQAVALDDRNVAAKQNLELVLRIQRPGKGKMGNDARAGYGFGKGNGATKPGNGY